MKTADELFYEMLGKDQQCTSTEMMIAFAKMHVDLALNYASENVRYDYSDIEIIQDLILSSYPQSNII